MKRSIRKDSVSKKRHRKLIEILLLKRFTPLLEPDAKAYRLGYCTIIVGIIPERGWHLSIGHPSRYPTWDEIHDARYALIPNGVTMAMILPPKAQYVNLHPNVFHLHELKDSAS